MHFPAHPVNKESILLRYQRPDFDGGKARHSLPASSAMSRSTASSLCLASISTVIRS